MLKVPAMYRHDKPRKLFPEVMTGGGGLVLQTTVLFTSWWQPATQTNRDPNRDIQFPLRPYLNLPYVASHQFISTKMNLTYILILDISKVYLASQDNIRPYYYYYYCSPEFLDGLKGLWF